MVIYGCNFWTTNFYFDLFSLLYYIFPQLNAYVLRYFLFFAADICMSLMYSLSTIEKALDVMNTRVMGLLRLLYLYKSLEGMIISRLYRACKYYI